MSETGALSIDSMRDDQLGLTSSLDNPNTPNRISNSFHQRPRSPRYDRAGMVSFMCLNRLRGLARHPQFKMYSLVSLAFIMGLVIGHVSTPSTSKGIPKDAVVDQETGEVVVPFDDEHANEKFEDNKLSDSFLNSRMDNFYSWFEGDGEETEVLRNDADTNGAILDFAVAGYAHCTLDLSHALTNVAAMPKGDVCTPLEKTVWYAYKSWPDSYGEDKLLKGSHCSTYIASGHDDSTRQFNQYLPKTKMLVGITHPIIWFKTFWDQLSGNNHIGWANNDPYSIMDLCLGRFCREECKEHQIFCVHKSRFHLGLAKLGKTDLSDDERQLLAPDDPDGGADLKNENIRNPIFLYDNSELGEDYFWESVAQYLGVDNFAHSDQEAIVRLQNLEMMEDVQSLDFCNAKYHDFRAKMMEYSHQMGEWLQKYFIPLALDHNRQDVAVANPRKFYLLAEQYKQDPCGILKRNSQGKFEL